MTRSTRDRAEIRVEGTDLIVDGKRVDLRFLRTFAEKPGGALGETVPRVKVYCRGCRRHKTVARVGLRVTADGVVDLQPNCHECRTALKARRAS